MTTENIAYRICGASLFCVLVFTVWVTAAPDQMRRIIQHTGILAVILLVAATLVSPIQNMVSDKKLKAAAPALRRCLGVSATVTAVIHLGFIAFSGYVTNAVVLLSEPQFRNGTAGLVTLLVLSLSSFSRTRRLFRLKEWKSLHRLIYVALPLIFLHWLSSPGYSALDQWGVLFLATGLIGLRLISVIKTLLGSAAASKQQHEEY